MSAAAEMASLAQTLASGFSASTVSRETSATCRDLLGFASAVRIAVRVNDSVLAITGNHFVEGPLPLSLVSAESIAGHCITTAAPRLVDGHPGADRVQGSPSRSCQGYCKSALYVPIVADAQQGHGILGADGGTAAATDAQTACGCLLIAFRCSQHAAMARAVPDLATLARALAAVLPAAIEPLRQIMTAVLAPPVMDRTHGDDSSSHDGSAHGTAYNASGQGPSIGGSRRGGSGGDSIRRRPTGGGGGSASRFAATARDDATEQPEAQPYEQPPQQPDASSDVPDADVSNSNQQHSIEQLPAPEQQLQPHDADQHAPPPPPPPPQQQQQPDADQQQQQQQPRRLLTPDRQGEQYGGVSVSQPVAGLSAGAAVRSNSAARSAAPAAASSQQQQQQQPLPSGPAATTHPRQRSRRRRSAGAAAASKSVDRSAAAAAAVDPGDRLRQAQWTLAFGDANVERRFRDWHAAQSWLLDVLIFLVAVVNSVAKGIFSFPRAYDLVPGAVMAVSVGSLAALLVAFIFREWYLPRREFVCMALWCLCINMSVAVAQTPFLDLIRPYLLKPVWTARVFMVETALFSGIAFRVRLVRALPLMLLHLTFAAMWTPRACCYDVFAAILSQSVCCASAWVAQVTGCVVIPLIIRRHFERRSRSEFATMLAAMPHHD